MDNSNYDVLIVGAGIAGLSAGMRLADQGFSVGIISRTVKTSSCNSYLAQGGIIYTGEAGDPAELAADIQKASNHTSNMRAINVLLERSSDIFDELLIDKAKTNFETGKSGELLYTMEAAHSRKRIAYKADYTGRAIHSSMLDYLSDKGRFPNITILSSHTAIDLITPNHHGTTFDQRYDEHQIVGAYIFDQKAKIVKKILSKITILATGGFAGLYLHNTNVEGTTGDGHAMAKRAGAYVSNMEFVQFHPTTFYDHSSQRRFLISEAVRGEGGILLNSKGEAFMQKYHPQKELASRDIVARAILDEMLESKEECVYLDISHKDADWIRERFPTIHAHCLENKIDMTKTSIPVVPASHYTCGGVQTDIQGKTSVKNLYAVGEVACTGLHGANRLASTSLTEGLTWGYLAAEDILTSIKEISLYEDDRIKDWAASQEECDMALIAQDWLLLKQTMWNYVGISRSADRLKRAQGMLSELRNDVYNFYRQTALDDELIGLRNAIEVALMVVQSSSMNRQSIGCFHRRDADK